MKTKNISKYILNFIKENKNDEKISDNWKTKENLIAFEKLLKKENKSKDLNKPKRGKSSFLYFCDEYKSIVKKDLPDYSNKQIISYLGVLWKQYKEDKPELIKKYEKIAEVERNRYKKEMLIYKEENIVEDEKNSKKTKDILDDITSLDNTDMGIKDKKVDKKEKKERKEEKEEKKQKETKEEKKQKKEKEMKEDKEEKKEEEKNVDEKEEKKVEEDKDKKKKKDKIEILVEDEKGFNKYLKKRKNKFIEEYPELNGDQLFEKIKKKWASLSEEKKQKYKR